MKQLIKSTLQVCAIAFAAASFTACGGWEYCDLLCDCIGCTDNDEEACDVSLSAQEDIADIYDCKDEFDNWNDCREQDNQCRDGFFSTDCASERSRLDDCIP